VLVLVGPGRKDFGELTKERYMLDQGERVDLFIYLNVGDGPIDLTKVPTLRKDNLIGVDDLFFVMPLAVNARGSLRVVSSNGFGNTLNTTETLTIVHRDGRFVVAGFASDFYNSRDDSSIHCSINYLNGTSVSRSDSSKDKVTPHKLKAKSLSDWRNEDTGELCKDGQ
jgi:hypothetical protein